MASGSEWMRRSSRSSNARRRWGRREAWTSDAIQRGRAVFPSSASKYVHQLTDVFQLLQPQYHLKGFVYFILLQNRRSQFLIGSYDFVLRRLYRFRYFLRVQFAIVQPHGKRRTKRSIQTGRPFRMGHYLDLGASLSISLT